MVWPHGPHHQRLESGLVFVTGSTYLKLRLFSSLHHREIVKEKLLRVCEESGDEVHGYVVLPNHYHLLLHRREVPLDLGDCVRRIHRAISTEINKFDGTPGQRVMYQYWDSQVRGQRSYLARLKYIHENPVRHGYCKVKEAWDCSSYSWFLSTAPSAVVQTVESFDISELRVHDPF